MQSLDIQVKSKVKLAHTNSIQIENMLQRASQNAHPIEAYNLASLAESLAQRRQQLREVAEAQLELSNILIKNGAYDEAMSKNILALKYFQQCDLKAKEAKCWSNMAIINGRLGEYEKQLKLNQKSLAITQAIRDKEEAIKILNNIGDNYMNLKKWGEAIDIFEENLKNPDSSSIIRCVSLKNLGEVHFHKEDYQSATSFFKEAIALAEDTDHKFLALASKYYLGKICLVQNEANQAYDYIRFASKHSPYIEQYKKEFIEVLEAMIEACVLTGRLEEVKGYFQRYTDLQKAYTQDIQLKTKKNLQFKFDINEIEKERALLKAQNLKLQQANEKIANQSEALKAANLELKNFAHVVSHDLKEPIRTINSFITLLEKDLGTEVSPHSKEYFNFIRAATNRMYTFVGDILSYATADNIDQAVTKVDCNKILASIEMNISHQLKETNGRLLYQNLPIIPAHRSLVLQVFQNLISNAIKFRKPDVPPIVNINGVEEEEAYLFEIEDNGIGIKAEDQASIFELFRKLHNQKEYGGSGIGLSTVSKVLKKYNATIKMNSEFGVGTTFTIRFPKERLQ